MRPGTARGFGMALALLGALAASPALPAGAPRVGKARQAVDARNRDLGARVDTLKVASWERLGGVKARTTRVFGKDDTSVIYRQPSRGLGKGMRSNRAMQVLATELGDPHMVPAAVTLKLSKALGEFAAGEQIMVMVDESNGFRGADEAPAEWLEAISEESRLIAATIDLLVQYRDRKLANLLVNDRGDVRLIDPDSTFVSKSGKPAYRSQFFAGMRVGYRSRQAKLSDLPRQVQALVVSLADAKVADIMDDYGVDEEEAGVILTHARGIRDLGLTAAAEAYVSTLQLKTPR